MRAALISLSTLLASVCSLDQIPFQIPQQSPKRIAIIGAGPSGSSAAYFLSFLAHQYNITLDVTLFEQSDYIGGRSTIVYPFNNHSHPPVELGGSIFVEANRNLVHAVKQFNLSTQTMDGGKVSEPSLGIWDGDNFVYEEWSGFGAGWWNIGRLIWNYGISPIRTNNLVKATVERFVGIYSSAFQSKGPYSTIRGFAEALDFDSLQKQTSEQYYLDNGVSQHFIDDLTAAATRVNYGTNPSHANALLGMVAMAAENAMSVKGGNRQIYEHFANASGADLRLNTTISTISKSSKSAAWLIHSNHLHSVDLSVSEEFDAVLICAPFHQSRITLLNTQHPPIPHQKYVQLHVTVLVTNASRPMPGTFHKSANQKIHKTILSTFAAAEAGRAERPLFNSLNYLADLGEVEGSGQSWSVKLFSEKEMDADTLEKLFGEHNILWSHRKIWFAYPDAPPLLGHESYAPIQLSEGLYYVGGYERMISTMETQTIAAWNTVSLLMKDIFKLQINKSWAEWYD